MCPIFVKLLFGAKVIVLRVVSPFAISYPISVTLAGKWMDVIDVPTNATAPTFVTVSGIVYDVMLEQFLNIPTEIVVGLVRVTEVKLVQPSKIELPNVAPSPKIVALCRFVQP